MVVLPESSQPAAQNENGPLQVAYGPLDKKTRERLT
jgi:hypothetical protein